MLKVKVVMVPLVARRFVVVTETAESEVIVPLELVRATIVPEVARKLVPVAEVNESEVIVPFVEVKVVMVPLAEASVLIVPELAIKELPVADVKPKLVAKRLVEVVLVPVAFTQVRPVTPKVSTLRFVKEALVAKRLVEVTDVDVTFPRFAFQRFVALPSENVRSEAGMRFEDTKLETARKLVVAFVMDAFAMVAVPVAVRSEVERPPKSWTVVVVKLPRAVTDCNVSRPMVLEKLQNEPLERQIPCPDTVAVANEAAFAKRFEEEAVTAVEVVTVRRSPVAFPKVRFVIVPEVAKRFVVVTETADKLVIVPLVETRVSIVPLVAVRSETNKLEPVAFAKVAFWRLVLPSTVRTPFTVAEVLNVKSAVEVPPANWMALVVVLPAFVTVWRFGVVPEGQLVPLARHTAIPPTKIAEEVTVLAESVLA